MSCSSTNRFVRHELIKKNIKTHESVFVHDFFHLFVHIIHYLRKLENFMKYTHNLVKCNSFFVKILLNKNRF